MLLCVNITKVQTWGYNVPAENKMSDPRISEGKEREPSLIEGLPKCYLRMRGE